MKHWTNITSVTFTQYFNVLTQNTNKNDLHAFIETDVKA